MKRTEHLASPARRRLAGAAALSISWSALLSAPLISAAALAAPAAARPIIEVWKSPSCGCCVKWVDHLKAAGFTVKIDDTAGNANMRARLGMPSRYGSCHTARVGGYVIEGHVPAADIQRLLKEKPDALGLAVPGMPLGSPGMETPDGQTQPYEVLLVLRDGQTRIYRAYR